jgi:hypothetical protein
MDLMHGISECKRTARVLFDENTIHIIYASADALYYNCK